jgi:hypothetical protein
MNHKMMTSPTNNPGETGRHRCIVVVYPETRRRINVHCSAKGMTQPEYIDSVVPVIPGDTDAKAE